MEDLLQGLGGWGGVLIFQANGSNAKPMAPTRVESSEGTTYTYTSEDSADVEATGLAYTYM